MKLSWIKILTIFTICITIYGWGSNGHKIINRKSIYSFHSSLSYFYWWSDSLSRHASDADYRKSSDPTESPRHYIDIDNYSGFLANGRIPQTLDSLISIYGINFVTDNGTLPFAIIATTDSVKKYFLQHNWQMAMIKASDLGHYIADAHNPLHITRNYNGQYTNQTGVHSRYETQMINSDTSRLIYTGDTCLYVSNVNEFAFGFIYNNYQFVDSLLKADSISYAIAGNYGSVYLQQLWNRTGSFTIKMIKNSSNYLARLIYTAWIDAGSPLPTNITNNENVVSGYHLYQNYPNPFNPVTTISFDVPKSSNVNISIYDVSGKLVGNILNEYKDKGSFSISFNASFLSSGIYFYKFTSGNFSAVKKMILTK